jgi:hypothetical protein
LKFELEIDEFNKINIEITALRLSGTLISKPIFFLDK